MPNVNQGGGYSLTFSQKNLDVKEIIEDHKRILGKKFRVTDYICECIRNFENNKKNKNKNTGLNEKQIRKIVSEEIEKALSGFKMIESEYSVDNNTKNTFEELESKALFFEDEE